jgi:hypothetical protein
VIAAFVRFPAAPYQIRSGPPPVYAFMVRTVYTCGLAQPSALVAAVVSGAGVSSVPSTSAAFRASLRASSNRAVVNAASRRTRQRETNPVETGALSRAPIRSAARSIPITSVLASSVAAAVTPGP